MTQLQLIRDSRECTCCHAAATPRKRIEGEPNILALSISVYRKGSGKAAQKAARAVRICEACLIRALAPSVFGVSREGRQLLAAFRESLSASYSDLKSDDTEPERVVGSFGAGELWEQGLS